VLLGAFMIHGLQPGPMFITKHPDVFWATIVSMYLGNVMLLVLNLPLIPLWVKVLKVPYTILFPLILIFCLIGVYSLNFSQVEIALMIGFGVLGYLMKKYKFDIPPLILALVLGPMIENNLRLSLLMSQGDPTTFLRRPLSAVFMTVSAVLMLLSMVPGLQRRRSTLKDKLGDEDA
jgi:putative tricarboxylic transport membrane protein